MKCLNCEGRGLRRRWDHEGFITVTEPCTPCNGTGALAAPAERVNCLTCRGSGEVSGTRENAWGFVDDVEYACESCGGDGLARCESCGVAATAIIADEMFCADCAEEVARAA